MRDGYLRGALSRPATQRQMDVLAAFVAAGGSVQDAADLVGIRPSTVKRHLADLRARSGLTTEQLIYRGRLEGWLVVLSLEPGQQIRTAPQARGRYGGVTSTHQHDGDQDGSPGRDHQTPWCTHSPPDAQPPPGGRAEAHDEQLVCLWW